MQIKIGIIGTEFIVERTLAVLKSFPTFAPMVRIVEQDDESPFAAAELSQEVEVLLLSGPHAHRMVKEKLPPSIPIHYLPLTGAGLYKAIFKAMQGGKLRGGISIDTLTRNIVTRTLKDLGIEDTKLIVYDGPSYDGSEKLVEFHQRNVIEGRCSIAFTGMRHVAQRLTRLDIPNEWLLPSEQDIIVTLERALLSTESRRGKESQIVVGMIKVDDFGKLVMQRPNEHEVQKLKLDIHRMVLGYVESLDGYSMSAGGDEFLFCTTRGIFERETSGYKTIPLAKDASKSLGISLSVGIGFGMTANEAGTNARAALRKSREAGGNTGFIVREDATVIGPLEMSDPVQSVLAPTEPALIRKAEDAGMTSAYLSRLLTNMAKFGKYEYKVHDLAATLGISVRSAHRLILLWTDNGLVEISGFEKVPKGRPRQIFRFPFLMDKSL
ncbi:MAG: transcriptional regulator [Paenibacillus sp.]|nr:transcriptional regulator [Paenibacillus sp.]